MDDSQRREAPREEHAARKNQPKTSPTTAGRIPTAGLVYPKELRGGGGA